MAHPARATLPFSFSLLELICCDHKFLRLSFGTDVAKQFGMLGRVLFVAQVLRFNNDAEFQLQRSEQL